MAFHIQQNAQYGLPLHGLGSVGDLGTPFGDVGKWAKKYGQGIVKVMTAGIYDPSKNRVLVPFTGAQVRNFSSGYVSTATLGLVKPDKFLNSRTGRILGNVGAAAMAAAAAGATYSYVSTPTPAPTPIAGAAPMAASSTPMTDATMWNPSVTPSMTGSTSSFGQGLFPASTISAPTADFASMPTAANAFGAPAAAQAPALLTPSSGSSWSFPSAGSVMETTMTGMTLADMASRIMGKTAAPQLAAGSMTVQSGDSQPYMLPTGYTPYGGTPNAGSSSGYGNEESPVEMAVPWLTVGGLVLVGYLLMRKKK